MIATAPATQTDDPAEQRTTALTPRGAAIVALIRRNWFRDASCWHRASERFADLIAPFNLSREDVAAVAALWAAHYTD